MKKIMMFLLGFSIVTAVKAQEIPERKADAPELRHRKEMRHHQQMDLKALNLTEDQKAQFKKENESFHKNMEELKKNDGITVREWRTRMETLKKDHRDRVQGLLTAEQKSQLQRKREEGRARQEQMGRKRAEMMKEKLGLTDEQSAKMENNRKEMMEKMRSIREDKSLTEEKKREEMKELMKGQKEKMKSILTDEQMKKMKEQRMQHGDREGRDRKREETKKVI
jgi:Spy/CpxP family protein refolding chaperone